MQIQYEKETIEITIKRSKRTTACLRIQPDGTIEVRGPKMMSDDFVQAFVNQKLDWIIKKRREVLEHQSKKKARNYSSGELFSYLGKEYTLRLVAAGRKRVDLTQGQMCIYTTSFERKKIEHQVKEWYKNEANVYITSRVEYLKQGIPGTLTSISMENRKGRWGSCSNRGELTFNWRLMLAPPEIIDYVVVHELCHLKHMDHSPAFWSAVKKVLPDYKARREWLKENGISLNL